ncbi:uncharacterized protein insyn2b isoform X2 [Denticeps clupeoides]|uniref:uncharacterized protein insyn2b isoform X2 n=1 Tax=Denticeps clupeoides TaxID=299321 RepID=UPI0010A4A75F|nr:uncharacterized protein LOC114767776 isoform X2 [Denticeps clupeoides]
MGRRAADTSNPVPALGVPLAGGQGLLSSQKWGPLCSVGVQTSPGLHSLPSLKKKNRKISSSQGGGGAEGGAAMETMSLDRGLKRCEGVCSSSAGVKETLQKLSNYRGTQSDSRGGVYCQIKAVRTCPGQSSNRSSMKRNPPRYTNGSVVAPELVGGVCSEGMEEGGVMGMSKKKQPGTKERGRDVSLKGEDSTTVRSASMCSYATPPRPCRIITSVSPKLCGNCGRRQSQAPPCMVHACRRRATNQIRTSMTLPNPTRKNSALSQKPPVTSTLRDTRTAALANDTKEKISQQKQAAKQTSTQHTQTDFTNTPSQHSNQCTLNLTNKDHLTKDETTQIPTPTKPMASAVEVTPKPPHTWLSISSECETIPIQPPQNKTVTLKSDPLEPVIVQESNAPPPDSQPASVPLKEMDYKALSKDIHPPHMGILLPETPQCNGAPGVFHTELGRTSTIALHARKLPA